MLINVEYLENLRIGAKFDDFNVVADQPIRYKGDGSAPGPFDYFLASSALCAAYFAKLYCTARDIPTHDIKLKQNNIVDPENRYKQTFKIEIELPSYISAKDQEGILKSMNRCTVKRVIQNEIDFDISVTKTLEKSTNDLGVEIDTNKKTLIPGKDCALEDTILNMTKMLADLGINIEVASWRNIVPHVWSVHIRDADSPICFTNGKGATKESALCSALGEYLERLSNNYFYNDYYLGEEISKQKFVHYPDEKWFSIPSDNEIPDGLMDQYLLDIYNETGELKADHLVDTNSANSNRGICALPYKKYSTNEIVYIPVNLVGNLFVSNGMSAGNTLYEARVQALSEIFERAVKNEIIANELSLPDIPKDVIKKYPTIEEGIEALEEKGFPVFVKDASLGGTYPVVNVTIMNPKTGGVFASFGSHPSFEIALERTLTELLQGRSFEGLNDIPQPTFNGFAVTEHNNLVEHFIDSTGVISWKFFSDKTDYDFVEWDFQGTTKEEHDYLISLLQDLEKEIYIADYNHLGASACRILVPDFSEVYLPEDLIWENNNSAIKFRERILNIHNLSNEELRQLLNDMNESDFDEYMNISELIGIAFDEVSAWGQLDIRELKLQINLKIKNYEEAKESAETFFGFSDHHPDRRKYYQLVSNLLEVKLSDELEVSDYIKSFSKMYGEEMFKTALANISGEIEFYGLEQTDLNFKNIPKHQKLIESYKKLLKKMETSFN